MIVLPIIRNLGGGERGLKKSGRNDPPKLYETTQGRNDSGPKRLWAETTRNGFNPFRIYLH